MKSIPTDVKDLQEIVNALEKGNEQAFDYLFETYYTALCRFARAFVGSFEFAEDIVQEVFIHIWERGLKLDKNKSLDSYLYVAVRNGCVSFIRRHKDKVDLEDIVTLPQEELESIDFHDIRQAVENLPEQCRLILKLVVWEDMKYLDVADYLGISVNTVKTQIKIAYRELRKKFSRQRLVLYYIFFLK